MYSFGKRSKDKMKTLHPDLVALCHEVIQNVDFGVYETSRSLSRQMTMYSTGKSQLDGVRRKSKHQVSRDKPLARAFDCFPYEKGHNSFDGSDKSELMFWRLIWEFKRASSRLGIKIRFGAFWSFKDFPHIELVEQNT